MPDTRILIVEDEGIEALDIQHRLIGLGYAVPDIAVNGTEAIQKAAEIRPDLVLMDIMLPGEIDGVTAAEAIHTRFDIPVIYLTAYADENTLQRAKITEPYGYIIKPFQERELHITIDIVLYKHQMEKKLKESEKWFATTLKSIGDAVITMDQNGLVTFMNPVAEELTGWSLKAALHKRLTEIFNIINSHTRKPAENPVARVILEGFTVGLANHTLLIARTGKEILIDDSAAPIKNDQGNIIGVVLIFRDITEREKAEEALREKDERLSLAVEGAGMATWDVDLQTGSAVWSKRFFELLGYAPASDNQMTLEMWRSRVHLEDLDHVLTAFDHAQREHSIFCPEHRVIRADNGQVIWLRMFGRFIYNDIGQPIRLLGLVFDDTPFQQAARFINTITSGTIKAAPLSEQQELRRSGIEVIGNVPWGTHFCQFYETSQDLVETLVPYFREGLEANEFCMWVTSPPLQVEQAIAALRTAIPNLNDYLAKRQIEILNYSQWYARTGRFDADDVLQGWVDKLAISRQLGFEGLRLTGNTFWLEQDTWEEFIDYEAKINQIIGGRRMLALCTYSLEKCGVYEIMDVISNHQFALIKHTGRWEVIESVEHTKIEQALRESEERLRLAVWAANLGVFEWDMLTDRMVWENQRMYEIFGLNPQDNPLGKVQLLEHAIHPDDAASFETALADGMKPGRLFHIVCRIRRRNDGELRWIELSGRFERDAASAPLRLRGVAGDVTERKQAEETLQAQKGELIAVNEELQSQTEELNNTYQELQRQADAIREHAETAIRARDEAERRAAELDATISSIAAGVMIYDNSGKILKINETGRNLFGYSSDYDDLSAQDCQTSLNLCKTDGTPYETEETPLFRALHGEIIRDEELLIFRTPDKPTWLSATLAPIYNYNRNLVGVIFIFTDITERKRKVEEIMASERELLIVTLNSLVEGVVATDQEERIILFNEAAANLTGYTKTEAIGEALTKICYVIDDKTSEPLVKISSQVRPSNLILVSRNLTEIPVSISCAPIKATDGQIIGAVTVFQDISEKQKIEQELLKTEKLESLGILAGGIAHDFNNILAAILANLELAKRKYPKNEDIKKYLDDSVETTHRASELTKQLLTFSKGGAPVKKTASLAEIVCDTAKFALRGSKVRVEFLIPDTPWPAEVDSGQISQVIHNLVINAKQAMPKGGIIYISMENIMIKPGRFNPGNYIKITIKDQGVGIPKENLSKIFDPFFTTKQEGSGLGLATSYSIIKRHDGYLEVESEVDTGTTFFIYLLALSQEITLPESQKEIAASNERLKILIMDDEEIILKSVGEMLEYFGHQVTLVTNGAEAIRVYQQVLGSSAPFDVVIMDLTVPGGMGGQEAIAHLRDIDPKIKAIISSGYANDPIMSDYERFGFCGVVTKPYKFDELTEVLNKVVERKRLGGISI
jgi:PAS domain S-box-containing protein